MRAALRVALLLLGLLAVTLAGPRSGWAQGVAVDQATTKQRAKAQKAYQKAMKAFEAGRFTDALGGFQTSYDIVASPNSHLMVVRTLVELGRQVEAYEEASRVEAEAVALGVEQQKYRQTAEAVREEMAEIRPKIGLLTVEVAAPADEPAGADRESWPPDWELQVASGAVAREAWGKPLPVEPGPIVVELTTPEGTQTVQIEVPAGAEVELAIAPPAPEQATPPPAEPAVQPDEAPPAEGGITKLRVPAYIAGGVGVAGMALFAVFGALSSSTYQDLEDRCPGDACAPELEEDARDAKTQQTVANVSVVVGAVGLTVGAALFVLAEWDIFGLNDESDAEAAAEVSVGPGSVLIRGRF